MDWDIAESPLQRSLAALNRYAGAPAPDEVFLDDMQQRINAARRMPVRSDPGADHDAPRVLLLGYSGAGNTGADLRTIETIAQLRCLLAPREPRITLFALGDCFDHPLLAGTPRLTPSLPYLPDALDAAVRDADLVLNVEGSTYTSKFSDSLAGVLIGGIALAHAHGRPAIAYGVDSGTMSVALTRFVERNTEAGEIICRNEAARAQLASLGVLAQVGADTAWTYRALADARNEASAPRRVALCPNNPFWWPVRADAARARELDARGESSPMRYGQLHFHSWDAARAEACHAYLDRFAQIAVGLKAQGYAPTLVGMEQLDRSACVDLAARVPFPIDIVARGPHTLDEVAATVAHAACVVTTRYHAAVLAISHGVPVFGLSMDARIERLLSEAGCASWSAACDDDNGAQAALAAIASLQDQSVRNALIAAYDDYARLQRARFDAIGERVRAALEG
ncbi:polysaccharide pyruvyl transferase WcaK-like protein [Paraburkholderia sp. BL23I1N1]|uniref:polysaccharide pyruvyl transferase family protein n=1 Tax=Paraburkholderia sp. BL23I1N1 TaxID=1938802 RepID=UPI000E760467|nr:polysaccharide pyruvyl transferase family protein [Paraburkholderia sp. BL23I1N1]RKE40042.1 polysaccharide pyruvyl transferase WcaK-like protein [Paraburkholderia sp. BL23I1N1]